MLLHVTEDKDYLQKLSFEEIGFSWIPQVPLLAI